MTDAVEYINCSRPECEAGKTGACAEGHDPLESCPYYGKASENGEEYDGDAESSTNMIVLFDQEQANQDFIDLPSGEALNVVGVDEFLRWRPIRLITIVGDSDSGKTTLITSIYEQFLRGSFAGHSFAGSRTLIGLERRTYLSRFDSGLSVPDTPRTSLSDDLRFFHIAGVSEDEQRIRTDLMLSDRAGEKYRQARDHSDAVSELIEVANADRLVLLLDGERLTIPKERTNAIASVRQTLRALLDGGVLDKTTCVQVVITKIDLIIKQAESEQGKTQTFIDKFKEILRQTFIDKLEELTFFEIAARDPTGGLPPAHGVDKLLENWFDRTHRWPAPVVNNNSLPLKSEFDRLLTRTPMEIIP